MRPASLRHLLIPCRVNYGSPALLWRNSNWRRMWCFSSGANVLTLTNSGTLQYSPYPPFPIALFPRAYIACISPITGAVLALMLQLQLQLPATPYATPYHHTKLPLLLPTKVSLIHSAVTFSQPILHLSTTPIISIIAGVQH